MDDFMYILALKTYLQVAANDNPAIEPIVSVLNNIIKPDAHFDMSGSTFKVELNFSSTVPKLVY